MLLKSWNNSKTDATRFRFTICFSSNLLLKETIGWQPAKKNCKLGQRVQNNWATLQRAAKRLTSATESPNFETSHLNKMFETGLNWIYKSDTDHNSKSVHQSFSENFTFPLENKFATLSGSSRKMASEDFAVEICGENKFPRGSNLWVFFLQKTILSKVWHGITNTLEYPSVIFKFNSNSKLVFPTSTWEGGSLLWLASDVCVWGSNGFQW